MDFTSRYVTPHTPIFAASLAKQYVCATCYGQLVQHLTDKGVYVLCANCGEDTKGYVTRRYVERRQAESLAERAEASHVLRNVIPSPNAGKSETQLLKELGY